MELIRLLLSKDFDKKYIRANNRTIIRITKKGYGIPSMIDLLGFTEEFTTQTLKKRSY